MALWGKTPQWGLNDSGEIGTQDIYKWFYYGSGGNTSVITNYVKDTETLTPYNTFRSATNPQPTYMKSGSSNYGLLSFRTDAPLARTFNSVTAEGVSPMVELPSDNDLFVDALVKFVPRQDAVTLVPENDVANSAKFMVWLSAPEGAETTNLVVTAGRYDEDLELSRVNYVVTNTVVPGRWYRLTARAIKNATTAIDESATGFALYLDGVPVACAEGDYEIGPKEEMEALFAGGVHYSARAFFPPIRSYATSKPGLYGLAVEGRGWYDELGVVTEGNPLAVTSATVDFTAFCDTNCVTAITCTVTSMGEEKPRKTITVTEQAEVTFAVYPGETVVVTPTAAEGRSLASELKVTGNPGAVGEVSGYTVVMANVMKFEDNSRVVARINSGLANFKVGDQTYQSLEEAMEAANDHESKTLKVMNDILLDPDPEAENGQMRVRAAHSFILDLNGRRIKGQHFENEAAIYVQGRLQVIDSSVGGKGVIEADGTTMEVVSDADALNVNHLVASLTLGDEAVTNAFRVLGRVTLTRGELILKGGRYLTPASLGTGGEFYLKDYLAGPRFTAVNLGVTAGEGEYWQVVYDGKYEVRFETDRLTPSPSVTNVVAETPIEPPTVAEPGYSVPENAWKIKGSDVTWNFADGVKSNMTLLGTVALDSYTITYDTSVAYSAPKSYTVETALTPLPDAKTMKKTNYTFAGWYETRVCDYVTHVGVGATFRDSGEVVRGDLNLVATWSENTLTWANVTAGGSNVESNGTYAGSWSFTIPEGTHSVAKGTSVAVDRISFCLVNPLLYAKSAPYLAVVTPDGTTVVSALRDDHAEALVKGVDGAKAEKLDNRRVRLDYAFSGLTVKAGEANTVYFSSTSVTPVQTEGFLRLKYLPAKNDKVFGNCEAAGGTPEKLKTDRYLDYCPIYEVRGRLAEEGGAE